MNYKRNYYGPEDEKALCQFFVQMNADCDCNHSRIVWEWLRNAPCFEMFQLDKSGIWRENNEIVASLQLLSPWPGYVKVDNRSNSEDLLLDIIRYAEDAFKGIEDNKKYLAAFVGEKENNLRKLLLQQDYKQLPNEYSTLQYILNKDIPHIELPEGFKVRVLSEVYDFDRLSKLIWEGFNYEGKIPKIDDEVNLLKKHAWLNYNREICSVVIAPDGGYASFCGFWYENKTQTGYLEPMVTAKEYRKHGLGKAGVFNSLQILKSYGCKKVFVDPDEEPYNYYCKIGFEKSNYIQCYKKVFE
jgi:Acetyltransferase (GNAT) family.